MEDPMPRKLSYSPELFVDRLPALNIVLDKAHSLSRGEVLSHRVVIFHGHRGSGKTWLLKELQRRLHELSAPCLLDLETESRDAADLDLDVKITRYPFVLLLDNVSAATDRQLEDLESRLLNPLLQDEKVLVVLAERGQPHFWHSPALRLYSDEYDLPPFNRDAVEEQMQKQVSHTSAKIDEIVAYGGGYPWSTYLMASTAPTLDTLQRCVDLFLADTDRELRPYFTALSVLKAFDETRMAFLFESFFGTSLKKRWDYGECRRLRERLVATTFARWDADLRGYVLDDPLRLALEALLALDADRRDLWARLHCAAYVMYRKWAATYSESKDWWTDQKNYHKQKLVDAGYEPSECFECVGQIQEEATDA